MTADFPIPAGYALVPLEPTLAMIESAKDERMACFKDTSLSVGAALTRIYTAALAAAPPIAAVVGEPVAELASAFKSRLITDACSKWSGAQKVEAGDIIEWIADYRVAPSPATDPAATLIEALLAVQMSAVAIPDVAGEHAIKTATLAKVERALGAYSLSVPAKDRKRLPVTVCCGRSECGGECGNEWAGMEAVSEPPAAVVRVEASLERNYLNWGLHPRTADLVLRFSYALAGKLAAAEKKYGYSDGWAEPDWMDECREKLMEHITKGDPRDVAAYCAFLWHHGASTAGAKPSMQTIADLAAVFDEGVRHGAALTPSQALPVAAGEAVAHVPIHPRNGPLWMDTLPAGSQMHRSASYPMMPLYAGSPPTARVPLSQKWINTLANQNGWDGVDGAPAWMTELVRDVESAHGIVAAPTGEG